MINGKIRDVIKVENQVGEFVYPSYKKYCFSNIPSTILSFFNIQTRRPVLPAEIYKDWLEYEDCSKIVLLLIDGYGYNKWLKHYRDYGFFREITQKGVLSPITSVFPSTTAASLTTINTGLTPQEHALPEWLIYFREIDRIINTLPFTPLGRKGQDTLLELGVNPEILYSGNTIHKTLKEQNVKSFTFIKSSYAHSCYSKIVHRGSKITPYITLSDLATRLRKTVEEEKGPAYFYAYIDDLDAISHLYGPHTAEYLAELSALSHLLRREILEKTEKKKAKETLLLITSDHGQVSISPKETIYLNDFTKLENCLKRNKKGRPILPTGSPRDVFLHIEPNKQEKISKFLSCRLKKRATVMKTKEAIEMGLFGTGRPKGEFLERVGDLLILPYDNHTVWYEHIKGKKLHVKGYHGGLVEDEVLVPFAITRLSEMQ